MIGILAGISVAVVVVVVLMLIGVGAFIGPLEILLILAISCAVGVVVNRRARPGRP